MNKSEVTVIEKQLQRLEEDLSILLTVSGITFSEAVSILDQGLDTEELHKRLGYAMPGVICYSACRRVIDKGDYAFALELLCTAIRVSGAGFLTMAMLSSKSEEQSMEIDIRSKLARKGADARHAENRKIAEAVKAFYRENWQQFKSLEQAAEAAKKREPIAFRTAYKHIAEEAKKLRSAGKE